jgi:hypothetical protein
MDTTCTVGPAVNLLTLGDARYLSDEGVLGQSRPTVKFVPAQEYLMHWWSTTDNTSVLLQTTTNPLTAVSGTLYPVDFVVEMVSTI